MNRRSSCGTIVAHRSARIMRGLTVMGVCLAHRGLSSTSSGMVLSSLIHTGGIQSQSTRRSCPTVLLSQTAFCSTTPRTPLSSANINGPKAKAVREKIAKEESSENPPPPNGKVEPAEKSDLNTEAPPTETIPKAETDAAAASSPPVSTPPSDPSAATTSPTNEKNDTAAPSPDSDAKKDVTGASDHEAMVKKKGEEEDKVSKEREEEESRKKAEQKKKKKEEEEEAKKEQQKKEMEQARKEQEKRQEEEEEEEKRSHKKLINDTERLRRSEYLLRRAEDQIRYTEMLSSEDFDKFVCVTEKVTADGVRWTDMCARPALLQHGFLRNQTEEQFASAVMKRIEEQLPPGVAESITDRQPLPDVQVDENWVSMVLRTSVDGAEDTTAFASLLVPDAEEGLADGHESMTSGQANVVANAGARYAERLYNEARQAAMDQAKPRKGGVWDRLKGSVNRDNSADKIAKARQAQRSAPVLTVDELVDRVDEEEDARNMYYDEETDTYYHRDVQAQKRATLLQTLRNTMNVGRAVAKDEYSPKTLGNSKSSSGKGKNGKLHSSASAAHRSFKAPGMTDLTDRMTIVIFKEPHPLDTYFRAEAEDSLEAPATPELSAEEQKKRAAAVTEIAGDVAVARRLVNVSVDEHGNVSTRYIQRGRRLRDTKESAPGKAHDAEATVSVSAAPQSSPARQPLMRWRVVTVHRLPAPFVKALHMHWDALTHPKPQLSYSDLAAASTHASHTQRRIDMRTWEDIVRILFYGALRGLGESASRCLRMHEYYEGATFDPDGPRGAAALRSMATMMTELYSLSRRARVYSTVLHESGVVYKKLRRTLESPLTAHDHSYLSFLDGTLATANLLEEQSESLLFLQFSVAMNQTEDNLRTLTVFSTVFIPLNFILSVCGMKWFVELWAHSTFAVYAVAALMVFSGLTTYHWIILKL